MDQKITNWKKKRLIYKTQNCLKIYAIDVFLFCFYSTPVIKYVKVNLLYDMYTE